MNSQELVGLRFNKLVIINEEKPRLTERSVHRMIRCACDCGKEYVGYLNNVRSGFTKTCGNCVIPVESLDGEEWKPIEGFSGVYMASNLGRIRGNKGIIKQRISNAGYSIVSLYDSEKKKYFKTGVHRLVIGAFNGNDSRDVNHINGVKTDNRIENIEYVTKSENMRHAFATGLCKAVSGESHYRYGRYGEYAQGSKKVKQMTLDGKLVKVWGSIGEVKRNLGFSQGNICMCCKGKRNEANGFKWEYA